LLSWLQKRGRAVDPIPIENWPCAPCGRVRAEHVVGIEHPHTLSDEDRERLTETAMISLTRYSTRLREGKHDPPLSPPAERRRIREAAGFSQQQIADQLHVNRHTVGRGEKPAGHLLGGGGCRAGNRLVSNGRRMRGCWRT